MATQVFNIKTAYGHILVIEAGYEGEELKRYVQERDPEPFVLTQHCGSCGVKTVTTYEADPAIVASMKPDAATDASGRE